MIVGATSDEEEITREEKETHSVDSRVHQGN